PALERSLDEASPEQRVWAAGALAGVAPGRVPAAIARTAERDPAVAVGLGMALRYNPGARDAVPGLADLLRDDRPRVREFAAAALAEVGAPAGPAAPALAPSPAAVNTISNVITSSAREMFRIAKLPGVPSYARVLGAVSGPGPSRRALHGSPASPRFPPWLTPRSRCEGHESAVRRSRRLWSTS